MLGLKVKNFENKWNVFISSLTEFSSFKKNVLYICIGSV